jgi:Leucine-rich repeat (LRR) protein
MCYIGLLSVLRYLGLEGTQLNSLPPKILELEHLETQDLRRAKLTTLPVFKSMNLMSMIVDMIELTEGLGEMKGLHHQWFTLANMVSQSKRPKMLNW